MNPLRPFGLSVKKKLISRAVLVISIVLLFQPLLWAQIFVVKRVIDGDSLELSNGEKVRLIGIDTPESSNNPKARRDSERSGEDLSNIIAMGREAKEYLKSFADGQSVILQFDVQRLDRYGRTLAYVYLAPKNNAQFAECKDCYWVTIEGRKVLFLNAQIIRSGFAYPLTIPPDVKYSELFNELYRQARDNRRGLWGEEKQLAQEEKPKDVVRERTIKDIVNDFLSTIGR